MTQIRVKYFIPYWNINHKERIHVCTPASVQQKTLCLKQKSLSKYSPKFDSSATEPDPTANFRKHNN